MNKIIKLASTVFFIIFYFFTISHAEMVTKIEVIGNERIPDETIAVFGDINLNQNYEPEDINLIIKKLFESQFFSEIQVELKNNVLKIKVKENQIINLIIYKGIKADKYKDAITEILQMREKTPFIKSNIKSDVDKIKGLYRHLGFYFVEIEAEVQSLDNNRVNLIYTIDSGERAKIAKIFFLGDKKIRNNKLRNIITSQEAKFWKVLAQNVYLNEGRIELDKRLLKNYYRNRGYYEVEISSSNVEYVKGEGFVLTYSIDAGKRYRFGKIYANVADSLQKDEFFALDESFTSLAGQYYSQSKLGKVLNRIDELSQRKELQFITHNIKETLDGNSVTVEINISEGPKKFIERINIVGNNVTNDSVIRGEMIADEGDPYSELLVNKSINRLKSKNIFGKVNHKVLPGSSNDNTIIEIEVEEKPTGEIAAGAGVGTEGTSFNFFVTENNWMGRGIKLKGSLDLSTESVRGGIDVTNPNYNYSGNAVSASFNSTKTDRLSKSGYESTKTSASLGTSFEQYKNIFLSPQIDASYESVSTDATASTNLQKMEGDYTSLDFGYGITYDKRNQRFQPSEGFVTRFRQSLPIYADTPALGNTFTFNKYNTFTEDVIGALKFYARNINSLSSDEDVRVSSRIYLPASRLRGFQSGKFGPKDGDDHVGGNYAAALSFEALLPNLLPEETKTDVSLFLDTANLWGVDYDKDLDQSNTIRSSVGVTGNVFTPIGPLNLTLAQPLLEASTDKTETFTFRLGTSF